MSVGEAFVAAGDERWGAKKPGLEKSGTMPTARLRAETSRSTTYVASSRTSQVHEYRTVSLKQRGRKRLRQYVSVLPLRSPYRRALPRRSPALPDIDDVFTSTGGEGAVGHGSGSFIVL